MHSGTFWNILHTFWNILHTFWNMLHTFWNILHTFWNILHAVWNILEHSEAEFQLVHTDRQTDRQTLGLVELRLCSQKLHLRKLQTF